MELAFEARARSEGWREGWIEGWREGWIEGWREGWIEGRIHGTIGTARKHRLSDDVLAMDLVEYCGLSQEKALNEIWKYDHPEAMGQAAAPASPARSLAVNPRL